MRRWIACALVALAVSAACTSSPEPHVHALGLDVDPVTGTIALLYWDDPNDEHAAIALLDRDGNLERAFRPEIKTFFLRAPDFVMRGDHGYVADQFSVTHVDLASGVAGREICGNARLRCLNGGTALSGFDIDPGSGDALVTTSGATWRTNPSLGKISRIAPGIAQTIHQVAYVDGGARIFGTTYDGLVEVRGDGERRTLDARTRVGSLTLLPSGRLVTAQEFSSTMIVLDAETGRRVRTITLLEIGTHRTLADPERPIVYALEEEGTLSRVNIRTGDADHIARGVTDVAIDVTGNRIVTLSLHGPITVYDRTTLEQVAVIPLPATPPEIPR